MQDGVSARSISPVKKRCRHSIEDDLPAVHLLCKLCRIHRRKACGLDTEHGLSVTWGRRQSPVLPVHAV